VVRICVVVSGQQIPQRRGVPQRWQREADLFGTGKTTTMMVVMMMMLLTMMIIIIIIIIIIIVTRVIQYRENGDAVISNLLQK
jgi:heme/copper-type cytochrome/quinol oxidase subunit 2